ncbi:hypothetical protein PY650_36885, partial [Rhizobium calliandrae]
MKQLDELPYPEKSKFLQEMSRTPDGRQALHEAQTVAQALEKRFGSADPREWKDDLRAGPEILLAVSRINAIAGIVDRARSAERSRDYELKRSLSKGLG